VAEGSEDAAAMAFQKICERIAERSAAPPSVRDEFLRMLTNNTKHRVIDILRREFRGNGMIFHLGDRGFEEIAGRVETAREPAIDQEEYEQLLKYLNDSLRAVAELLREGLSVSDIAGRLECSVSTVKRRKKLIKDVWMKRIRRE
jgi:DNA-directed RNA polymerase specialized sigma24 family protein